MSEFYDEMQEMASELIAEFGQALTHISVTEGVYNPATGTTTNTTTTQNGFGAIFEFTNQEAGVIQTAGGLVQTNDRKLLLSSSGITVGPLPNDTMTVDGVVYTVLKVQTLKPAATVVMYELHLRR